VESNGVDLTERIEEWPRAAIRLIEVPDAFVHIHLLVTGIARVEQFDREGWLLEAESARWDEGGKTLDEPPLAEVLSRFGMPSDEAAALAADLRARAEPLARSNGGWWEEVKLWLGLFGLFIGGWIIAVALAIWLLIVLL
jgi:hypothetical protein